MVLVSWTPRISVSPFVLKLISLSWMAPWTSTGGTLVHREDACFGHQLEGGRPWVPDFLRPGAPSSLRRPLTIRLRLPIHQGDPVRLAGGALDVQGALGAVGAEHGRVHLDGGAVRREDARRASASSSRRGCTTIPTNAAGGRRSLERRCCRSSCSRCSCVRSAAARHRTRSSCAPRSGGCCGAPRPDAMSSAAESGVPGGAPGASRGSSALGPERRGFSVRRLDFVAGPSSRFMELSPESLGHRAVQLSALMWPLMTRADEGPGSWSAAASPGQLCRLRPSSCSFQSSLLSSTRPWPSTDWAGAGGCASAFLSSGALQGWAPGRGSMSSPAPSPLWARASTGREKLPLPRACHNAPAPYLFPSWPSASALLFLGNLLYRKLLLDAVFSFSMFYLCGFKKCILLYHG
uniref:Uncharacterized protein n=1 Tax=Aotus nancymaae TaxID=37293 RepID=A0A2K5E0Q6_AOTNA